MRKQSIKQICRIALRTGGEVLLSLLVCAALGWGFFWLCGKIGFGFALAYAFLAFFGFVVLGLLVDEVLKAYRRNKREFILGCIRNILVCSALFGLFVWYLP